MTPQSRFTLDPVFEAALRTALVERVAAARPHRSGRRIVIGGALTLGLVSGGVAVAHQLDILPGADRLVPLAPSVSVTRTGTASVALGARPEHATDAALEFRCLSAGSFTFPDGAGVSCTADDVGFSLTTHTVPLAHAQSEVTITASDEARWELVATYVDREVTPWAVNAHGETYGVANEMGTPDLIAVIATNDRGGYVYARELEQAHAPQPANPEEAAQWRGKSRMIPVYESDGRTIVGEFRAGG
jgi:hypothetical protein